MSIKKWINKWINKWKNYSSRSRHPYVSISMLFPPLDIEKVSEDLKLKAFGKEHGLKNHPPVDSKKLDDVESSIINYINTVHDASNTTFQEELKTYARRFNANSIIGFSGYKHMATKATNDFPILQKFGEDELYLARKDVVDHKKQLDTFKKENNLAREAYYHESKFLVLALLFFLIVVESCLNGFFIGETHTFGLMGGVFEALFISILNVSVGFIVGCLVIPQIHHIKLSRKFWFGFLIIFYLIFLIGFNFSVAHYRDALSLGHWEEATKIALVNLWENPFNIEDMKSWMLFFLGLLFSSIGLYKGAYSWDDPYPGYGRLDRKLRKSQNEYSIVKEEWLSKLTEIKEMAIESMVKAKQDYYKRLKENADIIASQRNLINVYNEHLCHLEQVANHLLTIYRESNRRARTNKAPERFNESWKLERRKMPDPPEFDPIQEPEDNRNFDQYIVDVNEALNKAIEALLSIEQLSEEELIKEPTRASV